MGKDQKGKELGKGISQRKDGYYVGRYTTRTGDREQKLFKSLKECRRWVNDGTYLEAHSTLGRDMTVDAWYQVWISNKEKTVKANTMSNYEMRYRKDIKPVIGNMILSEVKPLHCQKVLNDMADKGMKKGTIQLTKITMTNLFGYAIENDLLDKNPCNGSVKSDIGTPGKKREALTIEEQRKFLEGLKTCPYENQFRFVLQTGLRCGELCGLRWSDIDFQNRTLSVNRSMSRKDSEWIIGEPKSKTSKRMIPLTDEALRILKVQKEMDKKLNVISLEYADLVFLSKKGTPISNFTYDKSIEVVCKQAGIPNISMHSLRHTFATRCIEDGIKPKTLQTILGHSNISMTMDLYVHVTEDEKQKEMLKLKAV